MKEKDQQKQIKALQDQVSEVKEKALRYELLFDLSAYAVLVIENGKFVDCNQAAAHILGYQDKSSILNAHPSELSPPYQPDGEDSLKKAEKLATMEKDFKRTLISKTVHH